MPIDFPNTPTLNQTYTLGTRTWTYDGEKWVITSGQIGPTGPTGPTGPASTVTGPTGATGPTPTTVVLEVVRPAIDVSVGDGAIYFPVPPVLNGRSLSSVISTVIIAGITGTTDIQIARLRNVTWADMLSTKSTIDSGETSTSSAAVASVVNSTFAGVQTNDVLRVDIDAVSTTRPKGLYVTLVFA